jgi:hypothetical protein
LREAAPNEERRRTARHYGARTRERPGRSCGLFPDPVEEPTDVAGDDTGPTDGVAEAARATCERTWRRRRICSSELEAGVLTPLGRGADIVARRAFVRPPSHHECDDGRGKWSIGGIRISDLPFFDSFGRVPLDRVLRLNGRGEGRRDPSFRINRYFPGLGIYPTPQGNIPGSPSVSVEGDCGNFF